MSEEERFDTEESDDVEAHRRRAALADEASEQEESKDDDGDDVEAHRRRA
jgi:hypothetical protein